MLNVNGLCVQIKGRTILEKVSFDLEEKHGLVGLIGPNGAGKTTLMHCILGLQSYHGNIYHKTRRIGYCCDTPEFEPSLTAVETLEQASALQGPSKPSSYSKGELLRLVGLESAIHRRVGGFSRGMKQRLGIAAALIGGPEIILLDEPTTALDPFGRDEVLQLLDALSHRTLVVVSTHLLNDLQHRADTLIMLNSGQVIYSGPIAELEYTFGMSAHITLTNSKRVIEAIQLLRKRGYDAIVDSRDRDKRAIIVSSVDSIKQLAYDVGVEEFPEISDFYTGEADIFTMFNRMCTDRG